MLLALLAACLVSTPDHRAAGTLAAPEHHSAGAQGAMPQGDSGVAIIPRPASLTRQPGAFTLNARTVIAVDRRTRDLGQQLADYLAPATGFRLSVREGRAGGNAIVLRLARSPDSPGEEGYRLVVTPRLITISAVAPAGVFWGIQSLRQLLPPDIFREAPVTEVAWTAPAVTIADAPRFSWRGAHLDVARHFMPKEFVKKYLDLLALHKLNRFHWHLTEDQGWRLAVTRYPRLTDIGAWRRRTVIGHPGDDSTRDQYDGRRHGGFYTQADVREIVAYAAARFITIVPEIEMPGHSQAAIAAYPALGNTGLPLDVWDSWGVSENILNPSDSTIAFYQRVLEEVMGLFPGPWVHIGGDEATKAQWRQSPLAQARIRELGLRDESELQSWFIRQMDTFLTSRGRRLIGWDEILEGGLAPNATVMSWRGTTGGIAAARAGHDVVMTPGSHTYFDHYQSLDRASEPLAIGGFLPLDTVYAYEPVPPDLNPDEARHVLGAQAQLWTEYIPDPKQAEYMAFPRLCALAEVVWTPRALRDYADFRARLSTHLRRLAILDVNYRPL
jgi:hexosaminidase